MSENEEKDITRLQIEIERLQAVNEEHIKANKSLRENLDRQFIRNKQLKHKMIAKGIKINETYLKNNFEELIKIILIANIDNEEMRNKIEKIENDKMKLSKEKDGYRLNVTITPSQIMTTHMRIEDIEEILKEIQISKEDTISTTPAKEIAELEMMLKNSQYSWMKIINTWQIIDSRHSNKVRFQGTPEKVKEVIKEITQNQ